MNVDKCRDCGGWPHAMDCPELARIVAVENAGFCVQCGAAKDVGTEWDDHMQMVVEMERCPNGHSHGMTWRPPTDDDIREFGLVCG